MGEYYGPAIFNYNAKSVELRGENGILIHGIGTFSGSSVSVSFSSGTGAEKIYLIIKYKKDVSYFVAKQLKKSILKLKF